MTFEAAPERPARPPQPPVLGTLKAAWRLIREHPRQTLLPMAAIQLPLSLLTAIASAVLYFTVFEGELYPTGGLMGSFFDLSGAQLFAVLIVFGVSILFSTVGQAATVVAVAAAARGKPVSLAEALDPAFTRMAGLIVIALFLSAAAGLIAATIVGLLVLPYFALRFGLWLNVYMLEDVSGIEALRRSWRMMHGSMLRLLGVVVLAAVVAALLLVVISIPIIGEDAERTVRIVSDSILEVIRGTLLIPALVFVHAATTLFYLGVKASADGNGSPA